MIETNKRPSYYLVIYGMIARPAGERDMHHSAQLQTQQRCDFLLQADILKESLRNFNARTKCEQEEIKSEHAKELCHWKGMKSCSQTENLCSWLMTWFYFHTKLGQWLICAGICNYLACMVTPVETFWSFLVLVNQRSIVCVPCD